MVLVLCIGGVLGLCTDVACVLVNNAWSCNVMDCKDTADGRCSEVLDFWYC